MNKLTEIVTETPMSSARAFHTLTVHTKKDLWYVVVVVARLVLPNRYSWIT